MAPRYAHVHVEGDWGIRLGKGNITIEVWDKRDRQFSSVTIGAIGFAVSGGASRRRSGVRHNDATGRPIPPTNGD
jgi:hypothetical protein